MLTTRFDHTGICGICVAVPETVDEVGRDEYVPLMGGEKKLARHIKVTGIERRHVTWDDQKVSDLAIEAVQGLLADTGWDAESVDALILVTQNPDELLPATSMYVHASFPFRKDMVVFDINLGCSGFTTGIQTMSALLSGMGLKRGILIAGDIMKYEPVWKENGEWERQITNWLLFGSAVSATAIERDERFGEIRGFQTVDGNGANAIRRHLGILTHMDGNAVFSFTINEVVDMVKSFIAGNIPEGENIDYYVFHQAQKMILDNMRELLSIPEDRMLTSYREYGNTSSASIPLTMCAEGESIGKGGNVFLCGFGVGLAASGVYLHLESGMPVRVITTGRKYEHRSFE